MRVIESLRLDLFLILWAVQYVKQETQTIGEFGKEARATRLITERASRRIGQMAFELALARPRQVRRLFIVLICNCSTEINMTIRMRPLQHVTIIHKSNVLSVTDGLFRETVRGVPSRSESQGRYDTVTIAEQLVDSAVYR